MREWCSLPILGIAVALLVLGTSTAAEPTEAQMAIDKLIKFGPPSATEKVKRQLANSGLAPIEIDRIASEATAGIAHCLVGALVESDDPQSRLLLSLIAQATKKKDIEDALNWVDPTDDPAVETTLDSYTLDCASNVLQELGLPELRDAT